jgi:hypothetical protein
VRDRALDPEQKVKYVPVLFDSGEGMFRSSILQEAAALASLALFLGMIAIWAQVIAFL